MFCKCFGRRFHVDFKRKRRKDSSPPPYKARRFPAKQLHHAWRSLKRFNEQSLEKLVRKSPNLARKFGCAGRQSPAPRSTFADSNEWISASQPNLLDWNANDRSKGPVDRSFGKRSINRSNVEQRPASATNRSQVANQRDCCSAEPTTTCRATNQLFRHGSTSRSMDQLSVTTEASVNESQCPIAASARPPLSLEAGLGQWHSAAHRSWLFKPNLLLKFLRRRSSYHATPTTAIHAVDSTPNDKIDIPVSSYQTNSANCAEISRKGTKCPFYLLHVCLHRANNIPIQNGGVYVKWLVAGRVICLSQLVRGEPNPQFDEMFQLPIESLDKKVELVAVERNIELHQAGAETYLGKTQISVNSLECNCAIDLLLELSNTFERSTESKKAITFELTVNLQPKTLKEREMYFARENRPIIENLKKGKTQEWDAVVNVGLIEAVNLPVRDQSQPPSPFVRVRVANEKWKSKVINRTTHPRWNERFDLYTFADQSKMLELTVHDRDTRREETIGRCNVNLLYLAPDDTRDLYIGLQTQPETDVAEACILNPTDLQRTCQPYVRLMITVSGQPPNSLPHTLDAQQTQPLASLQPLSDYRLWHTLRDLSDVGLLTVTVHRAEQLLARDFNGKSDPFCVLQLGNCRVQTHTEYKTLTPEWQKTFHLRVRDIHHTLLISLFDEDSNKQFEFLGCVSIPLLTIKNGCHWYQLKSKSLTQPTKGQIMLEFRLQYNVLRAVWNTLHPQEKRRLDESETLRWKKAYNRFKENWLRVKNLFQSFVDVATYLDSCMRWDCPLRSAFAYLAFCLITLYFELWMLPVLILVPLLRNLFRFKLTGHPTDEDQFERLLLDEDEDDDEKNEKKGLRERYTNIMGSSDQIQTILDRIASYGERVFNTFNFSVPFLSYLAIVILFLAAFLLYFVPLRYLVLVLGSKKFFKKWRDPNCVSNNELVDFLSRVPDNKDRVNNHQIIISNCDSPKLKRRN